MKFLKVAVLLLSLLFSTTHAANDKASEESIRQLMEITQSRKMVEQMYKQMDHMMQNTIKQSLQSKNVSAEAQAFTEKMQGRLWQLMKEEASWEKLEPIYIKIYAENFTQEEIDGMLAFYKSPVGQSMIRKMPVVMQSSMREMQDHMQPVIKKMTNILQEEMLALAKEAQRKKEQGSKK